jgi:hypothetical protein
MMRIAMVTVLLVVGAGCGSVDRPWTDAAGTELDASLVRSVQAPAEHCGWESATFLFLGRSGPVPGVTEAMRDQYVRDPDSLFTDLLADTYSSGVELPNDAEFTGLSNGMYRVWIAPSIADAVFVESGDAFERWPRVAGDDPILCV